MQLQSLGGREEGVEIGGRGRSGRGIDGTAWDGAARPSPVLGRVFPPRPREGPQQEEKNEGQPESEDRPPAPRDRTPEQDQLGWFRSFSRLLRTSLEVTSAEV